MANSGHLYVFLHGLAVVSERANDFQIVLPDVSGHVQKAGNFLQETSIGSKSVLRLRGVDGGNAGFPMDCTMHLPNTSLTSQKRAATVWLPKPKTILSLLHATVGPPDYVAQTKDNRIKWSDLATIQILLYDYRDENEVSLEGHYWEPSPTGGAISLHLISTSEVPEGKEHEDETEDVMHEVLRNYPGITYKLPRKLPAPWIDPPQSTSPRPAYGDLGPLQAQGEHFVETANPRRFAFSVAELEHPSARLTRIGLLGRLHREKRRIDSLWNLPSPLGDMTSNCMTVVTP